MLTFPRSLVRQFRILFAGTLDVPRRLYRSCPIQMTAGSHGLLVRAQIGEAAVEYRQAIPQPPAELVTSLALLHAVEGQKPEPVTLVADEQKAVIARWQDGPIPRMLIEEAPAVDAGIKFPELPETWVENPPNLWTAFAAAQRTIDPNSSRYALGCIQLRGKSGVVAATDGSQLLRQQGFTFGFEDEVLIRGVKLFSSRELPADHPVQVGRTKASVVLRAGPWTFWLPVQEGRFPRVDDVVPSPSRTRTTLHLPPAQHRFLKENLPRLKCEGFNECVTLDLNGQIAVRSRESEAAPPTQLTLTRASYTGEPMRVVTSRQYLQRAIELGFSEVSLIDPTAAIVCRDGQRDYVWMAIDPNTAVKATPATVEIASPDAIELPARRSRSTPEPIVVPSSFTPTPMTTRPMETAPPQNRIRKATAPPANPKSSLIEQCHTVRGKLRELLAETNELIRSAKRQKQQERLVRSTLASLKQLQAAG